MLTFANSTDLAKPGGWLDAVAPSAISRWDPMAKFRISSDVQMAGDDRGTVLLNVRDGHFYGVNDVGRVILAALDQGKEFAAIVSDVETTYRQPRERVEADVRTFLDELMRRGLGDAVDE